MKPRPYGAKWRTAREVFLSSHKLCVICAKSDKRVTATVVDHIKPHKGNDNLFWSRRNWQALCASCHNSKTAKHDGGFGNRRKGDAVKGSCDKDGYPLHKEHHWLK